MMALGWKPPVAAQPGRNLCGVRLVLVDGGSDHWSLGTGARIGIERRTVKNTKNYAVPKGRPAATHPAQPQAHEEPAGNVDVILQANRGERRGMWHTGQRTCGALGQRPWVQRRPSPREGVWAGIDVRYPRPSRWCIIRRAIERSSPTGTLQLRCPSAGVHA